MNKKLIFVLVCFLMISLSSFCYADLVIDDLNDEPYQLIIDDQAELLSIEDEQSLRDVMTPLTEFGNIIFVSSSNTGASTLQFASDYYHNNCGIENGSLFLIDMQHRQIYIFSDGDNYKIITTSKANIITDNCYKYATNENYYKCAEVAFTQMNTLLSGEKISEPLRIVSSIIVSIVLAFIVVFFRVMSKYKIFSASSKDILEKCKINFSTSRMTIKRIGEHKVYNPPSSSSSGGGGGHSSHGSHSSGGGGGHGF